MNIPVDREKCTNPECDDGFVPGGAGPNMKIECLVCSGMGYVPADQDLWFRAMCDRHNINWKKK